MKKILKTLLFAAFMLVSINNLLAQSPPHPNGGNAPGSGGGNTPVGGGAPVGSGTFFMLGLAGLYGGVKLYYIKKDTLL